MLTDAEINATASRFAGLAYSIDPATSDSDTIVAAIAAVDAQVEQASADWLAALPAEFAAVSNPQQQRQLIACVIAARNGLT